MEYEEVGVSYTIKKDPSEFDATPTLAFIMLLFIILVTL
jgi:hypothetical protein